MSDQAFADATRPAPRVILRLPMLEYSLGHELMLIQQQNPLASGPSGSGQWEEFVKLPTEKQIAALMKAALVCSRSWQENKSPDRWVRFWGWMVRKTDWAAEIAEFRIYRAEGSSFPRMADPALSGGDRSSEGRTLGSPFMARLTAHAVGAFGERAFDLPLGMLQWMYFAHAELEGSCMIENEREREIREGIEKHKADYAREQAERKHPTSNPDKQNRDLGGVQHPETFQTENHQAGPKSESPDVVSYKEGR